MHHTGVLLRAAQVAGVFEGDPGVACFKQHRQDLAPQVSRFNALVELELAGAGHFFVLFEALLEGLAVEVVQIGHIVR